MKRFIPFLSILTFTSCTFSRPLTNEPPQNNPTYTVQYLFEHDGCKVYRFYDRGNYVYFTNCRGESMAVTDSTIIKNSTNLASGYPKTNTAQRELKNQ